MPGFLKRAEQKLLLNKPGIWSTRAHLVMYYGVLFLLVLATLCFLEPNDLRASSTMEVWIGFTSIIAGIGLIVWMIYLLRFNVFKKYGTIHPLHGLVTFLLYFISTGIIVSFGYVHPVVETVRANMAYSAKEVVNDINDINVKIYQLEYSHLRERWEYDTVELVKRGTALATADDDTAPANNEMPAVAGAHNYYREDSTGFSNKIDAADSLVRLNDSLYLVYQTPQFRFLSPYLYKFDTKEHLLTDFELFRKVYGHPLTSVQWETINQELIVLLMKYEYPAYLSHPPLQIEKGDTYYDIIQKKYRIANVDNSISHVFRKKYRWSGDDDLQVLLRVFFYITLGITLMIFIFRHTTIRTFFLSILAGVLITIFTALIGSFSRAEATSILGCLIIYTFSFFFISLTVWKAKKRSAIAGIAINLFVLMITALPITMLVWYYEYRQNRIYRYTQNFVEPFDLEKYAIYAEVGGIALLLVLIATYISKVYRRWYSLPEN